MKQAPSLLLLFRLAKSLLAQSSQPFTRNYGSTVIPGGWAALRGLDHGKLFEEKFRFADVWSKRNGRWYVVLSQLTPSEKP